MKIWLRRWMVVGWLALCFPALALASGPSLEMIFSLSRFVSDMQLAFYEPENTEFQENTHSGWEDLQQSYRVWLPTLPDERRGAAQDAWQEIVVAVQGDGQFEGMLDIGYDASLSGNLTLAAAALRVMLLEQLPPESISALEWLKVEIYRQLSSYMLVAAAPFGSYALPAGTDEIKQVDRLAETDAAWQRALAEAEGEQRATLVRAQRRWDFIRETLLNASQRSLPYIVNVQMNSIIRDLDNLM